MLSNEALQVPFFQKKFLIWVLLILWWWGGVRVGGGLAMWRPSPSVTSPPIPGEEMRSNGEGNVSLFKTSWTRIFEMSRTEI